MREVEVIWSTAPGAPEDVRSKTVLLDFPDDVSDLSICEAVFRETNTYAGPIWDALLPLPEDRTHTALSVGDHVRIDGVLYRCQMMGFQQVDKVSPNLRFMEPGFWGSESR